MKLRYKNKLKVGQATLDCLLHEDNVPLYEDILALVEETPSLKSILEDIKAWSQKQTSRTGYAALKRAAKKVMVDAGWGICCGLQSLASKTNNVKLAAQVEFARTTVGRGGENDVVNRCKAFLTLGNANADALAASYNVKAEALEALDTAITGFGTVQSKPRNGRAAKTGATKQLKALFEQLDTALNDRIDPLMEPFRGTHPAFYNEYKAARSIVDSVASHGTNGAQASSPVELPKAA